MCSIAMLVAGGIFFGAPSSFAADELCTPSLSVKKIKETAVKMKVGCSGLKGKEVSLKVTVSNTADDSNSQKTFDAKLGKKKGTTTIQIRDLDSSTPYSFKVKMKERGTSGDSYTPFSGEAKVTTKGSKHKPQISKITNITDNSVKLRIVSNDLENKAVNVQVSYQKKKSWTKRVFSLTLDGDGEGIVFVDGLASDTAYRFKAQIKKSGESAYSIASPVKTATTESD